MDCFPIQSKNTAKKEGKKIRKHLCGLYVVVILILVVVIVQMILQVVNYDSFSGLQFWKKKKKDIDTPESYLQKELSPIEEEDENQSNRSNEQADYENNAFK